MRTSKIYDVPNRLATLYDFVNSVDCRCYSERGVRHTPSDALGKPTQLREWLKAHGMTSRGGEEAHRNAVALRTALRAYLKMDPEKRLRSPEALALSKAARAYPLIAVANESGVELEPCDPRDALGAIVLAQLHQLSAAGELDRLKMCASDECEWIFFDRSKPGNRRWCSSVRCGNRNKTRNYRARLQDIS
jgi:predicted RNA-binding Zn ribbon-like protein